LISKNDQLQRKANHDDPIILTVDGHATHVTSPVLAYASSQKRMIMQFVVHSADIN
jgi:hypothetical protein